MIQKLVATCDVLVFWEVLVFWDVLVFLGCYDLFVTTLQDDSKDSSNIWYGVFVFWDATIFCNNFASKFMLSKRRFWKTEQKIGRVFSRHF